MKRVPLIYVTQPMYHKIRKDGKVSSTFNLSLPDHPQIIKECGRAAIVYDNQCLPLVIDVEESSLIDGGGKYDVYCYIRGTVKQP